MSDSKLQNKIEALLFALGRPMSRDELSQMLRVSKEELEAALGTLVAQRFERGVICVDDGREVELRVAGDVQEIIEEVRKEELSRDIGRAGLETLSAILYRGPLTRSEIDFIRGVNSSQILRTLLMRGLVRRVVNPKDERSYLYEPTTELMAQLGITKRQDLAEFDAVRTRLTELEETYRAKEELSNDTL
ncbi:MAG TPA: SMC-Scp complex subunit ScpB [Candidatus Paceibacterota bacterium]|nr:SMC-Scp complex subunit ScpB [Candidatus Paceibacterota bacterium]